ncbi:MAG: LysR family transcriptional regulator, partial [Pseudomonadota bacterium]
MFDWNDLRFFLELSRRQTYVSAAERLGVDHTTVARRIKALETALDQRLFERASAGFALTPAGRTLLRHAEAVESHSLSAAEEIGGLDAAPRGVVRIATTEAIGAAFLANHAGELRAKHPDLELEVVVSVSPPSLTARDIDLALTLSRPRVRKWSAQKLTDYTLYLYGSRAHLAELGPIERVEDLRGRNFIGYIDDLLLYDELKVLDAAIPSARTVFRSNSIVA